MKPDDHRFGNRSRRGALEGIMRRRSQREKRNNLKIREARIEDRDAARKITLSAFRQYAAVMPPPRWEGYRENILATLTEVAPALHFVAEKDGMIVGSVLLYPPGTAFSTTDEGPLTCPEVRLLAVAPEARGQGIGAALMKECTRRARRLGAACLNLHTTDMMQVAMRMYERMGFVRVPELDFHPYPNITVKAYRLELDRVGKVKRD
jgi:ribosomal protein S18 acetylase RimI-like enzyme